jgi:hypothetical protein
MRRKVILTFAALLMVASGVAAVSAYEAHTINVKAHVENALYVDTAEIDFGTSFPEEIRIAEANITLSESANASLGDGQVSGNLSSVTYKVFAEYKTLVAGDPPEFYKWMGPWLWVGDENATDPLPETDNLTGIGWVRVGAQPDTGFDYATENGVVWPSPMAKEILGFEATLDATNRADMLRVMLLTPAFHNDYNQYTDELVKPDWWLELIEGGLWPRLSGDGQEGVDLGVDLKIQVTNIARNP